MKNIKLIFSVVFLLLFVNSTFAQSKFYGTVTRVLDGKTVLIEPQSGVKIKFELENIEVPEPEQNLHQVVKDHLKKLLLNQVVEFRPIGYSDTKSTGQVFLKGVNISQQMVRDGAAWYAVAKKSSHTATEVNQYQSIESQAKAEKRGIWSVANMKPAWEFRAEKAEKIRQEKLRKQKLEQERLEKIRAEQREKDRKAAEARRIAREKANTSQVSNPGSGLGIEVWSENSIIAMPKKPGYQNLYAKYIPQYGVEYTITEGNLLPFKFKKNNLKIEGRSLHIKHDKSSLQLKNVFGMDFLVKSEKANFAKSNYLTIYADKKAIKLGKAYRLFRNNGGMVQELLLYQVSSKQLATISKAKNVKVKIGLYNGSISSKYKKMIKDLVESTK